MLIANAVASERTDADYLFHRSSGKARHELVSNLRQSAFFWTGFSEANIRTMIDNSEAYLGEETASTADQDLLTSAVQFARFVLSIDGWSNMERSHELGMFLEKWPKDSAEHWAFDNYAGDFMTGISPLLEAQKHVNARSMLHDPGEGLAGAGIRALADESALNVEEVVKGSSRRTGDAPTRSRKRKAAQTAGAHAQAQPSSLRNADTYTLLPRDLPELPPSSEFLHTRIVGTVSSKLSYLITQVLALYQDEKIIIFYDGKNTAFYIAQMLELLQIKHEIYDSSLAANLKSQYVVRFDQEPEDRVLLMDVKQAAFGLNLSSASRIFFVNPVYRPDIEAQAIKRAHRFGQTRKVHVETLVLKGTIEDKMLERSKRMTRAEHADASKLEDDSGIREIIQSARLLPVDLNESRMARLDEPQQLWGRQGWRDSLKASDIQVDASHPPAMTAEQLATTREVGTSDGSFVQAQAGHGKKRMVLMVDRTDHSTAERYIIEESPKSSRPKKRVRVTWGS